jgi:hypothetical protein
MEISWKCRIIELAFQATGETLESFWEIEARERSEQKAINVTV